VGFTGNFERNEEWSSRMYLIAEFLINLSIFFDRLKASIKSKRWISEKEYYGIKRRD
jgi:hypothetical protein